MDDTSAAKKASKRASLPPEIAALIPSGKQIYDAIMGKVEPDLLSDNLPTLVTTHKGEAPEERKKRMARYTKAFREYDKRYKAWISGVKSKVEERREAAFKAAEQKHRSADETSMADIEAQFAESVPPAAVPSSPSKPTS